MDDEQRLFEVKVEYPTGLRKIRYETSLEQTGWPAEQGVRERMAAYELKVVKIRQIPR